MSSKAGQIKSLLLEIHPLDCWKNDLFDFAVSIICSVFFLKLADKVDMDEVSDVCTPHFKNVITL